MCIAVMQHRRVQDTQVQRLVKGTKSSLKVKEQRKKGTTVLGAACCSNSVLLVPRLQ